MPLVVIQHKPGRVLDDMLQNLAKKMPEIVADALSADAPGAELTSTDIEVWVQEGGKLDVNTKDLEIIIWATSYPARLENLDFRKEMIVQQVKTFLADYDRNLSGFVWVLLQPASFGEL